MSAVEVTPSPEGVPGALTDTAAITAQTLTFEGAEETQVNGYLALPTTPTSHPGMLVIHEALGLNDHIRDICNRLANLGYAALGVDLFTREGGPPPRDDLPALMARLFSMPDARVLGDLSAAVQVLRALPSASGRVGCIGFCMGGRYTLLLACSTDALDAAVDCWGGFIDGATPDERSTPARPDPPLELAAALSCPLLAAIGGEDHNPSPQIGELLRERASASGHPVTVNVYDGAGHAFLADYRPTYRPQAAAALWRDIVPFLAANLSAPPNY
jgi:carboxymethylenebutenolidase